ncbi:hypothetical protein [Algoriphagus sp.]|uniref:hypothetical protein n=1 Tax=Algoriphagus sp. TaxID=1872435 RepID=UPI0026262B6D|nr:hypothetical protein [Algoriphagus sp.]
MLEQDDIFTQILAETHDPDFNSFRWLRKNFLYYKATLIWPEGLPPIRRTTFTLHTKWKDFHQVYTDFLQATPHQLNNFSQTLTLFPCTDN